MKAYGRIWRCPGRCVSGAFEVRKAAVVGGAAPGAVHRRPRARRINAFRALPPGRYQNMYYKTDAPYSSIPTYSTKQTCPDIPTYTTIQT